MSAIFEPDWDFRPVLACKEQMDRDGIGLVGERGHGDG